MTKRGGIQGTDNFEFDLISDFAGYNSANDKTKIAPNFLVRGSKNVFKKISGTIANRCGMKRYGEPDDTADGTKSSFDWDNPIGIELPLRVLASGVLQVMSLIADGVTPVWYDLYTDADHTRYCFAPWWDDDELKERLLMVNGTSDVLSWGGGLAKTASFGNSEVFNNSSVGSIVNPGTGYSATQVLNVNGGVDGQIDVLTVGGSGEVTSFQFRTAGNGYTSGVASTSTISGAAGSGFTFNLTTVTYPTVVIAGTETPEELGFLTELSSDKVLNINGNEYTYLGIDGQSFYGVVGDPSGEAVGSIVLQALRTDSDVPSASYTSDICVVLGNQLIVGSYSSRVIYISADANVGSTLGFTDFSNAGDLIAGDPDNVTLDDAPVGMVIRNGSVFIGAGTSDWYVVTPNTPAPVQIPIPGGSNYALVYTKVEKKTDSALSAPLAQEFITTNGDDIVYLSQDNQLRTLSSSFSTVFTTKFPTISQELNVELSEEDFTGGALYAIGDYFFIIAPITGRTYVRQVRQTVDDTGNVVAERLWHPFQTWQISRMSIIDGVIYGHSAGNPQLYQLFNTGQWADDIPADGGTQVGYDSVMRMAYRDHGRRNGKLSFDKIYVEGYMTQGTTLMSYEIYDYLGATDILQSIISSTQSPAKFYTNNEPPAIGLASIGDNPLGDGLTQESQDQESLPKFRAIVTVPQVDCFEYQLVVYSDQIDSRWEILSIGTDATLSDIQPIELNK